MMRGLLGFVSSMPAEAGAFLLAMLPISELRGAIPWAVAPPPIGGGLPWYTAYFWAVLGNLVPVPPLLLLLGPLSQRLSRHPWGDRFFTWLFARTRRRGGAVEKYETLGLLLFVAIPLPVTGAWTGTVAAFIFGIRFRWALPAIAGGVCVAGVIVTLVTQGILGLGFLLGL
jgi:uncharacterized membrane protein